jgi:hypothetical protein
MEGSLQFASTWEACNDRVARFTHLKDRQCTEEISACGWLCCC